MQSYDLIPAFTNPVQDSQQVFRVVLEALSEPGLSHEIGQTDDLAELNKAGYALALTLLDSSTTVWLSPRFVSPKIRQNLAFHCGCRFVDEPEKADFAFLTTDDTEVLTRLNAGTDRDPEHSCTAVMQLKQLDRGEQTTWTGPGIKGSRKVALAISNEFWKIRKQKNLFPRGIDVFFVAQNRVLGLARTTHVQSAIEA